MDINSLRYFVGVAKAASITKAAKHLFLSQQGLNKAIHSMETELGFSLVERTRSGTVLTPDGKRFLAFCEQTIAAFDRTVADIAQRQLAVSQGPSLAIGATAYALHTVFDDLANNKLFEQLRVQELAPSNIAQLLADPSNTDHLYVTDLFENSTLAKRMLSFNRFLPIFQTEFGLVVPESFSSREHHVNAADLVGIEFACFHDESIDWVLEKTYGDKQPPNIILKTSDSTQLMQWAESRQTAVLLDSFAFYRLKASPSRTSARLRFITISDMPRVTTGFLFRHDAKLSNDAKLFIRSLQALFRTRHAEYSRMHPV
ncbi:MAG TPA: LysR family transcriptional regulator [Candidatus Aphodovivens excrementavium]|nr:LysR family transcriptional regulator [Candidatus Aphodovivens excrementavium]